MNRIFLDIENIGDNGIPQFSIIIRTSNKSKKIKVKIIDCKSLEQSKSLFNLILDKVNKISSVKRELETAATIYYNDTEERRIKYAINSSIVIILSERSMTAHG